MRTIKTFLFTPATGTRWYAPSCCLRIRKSRSKREGRVHACAKVHALVRVLDVRSSVPIESNEGNPVGRSASRCNACRDPPYSPFPHLPSPPPRSLPP